MNTDQIITIIVAALGFISTVLSWIVSSNMERKKSKAEKELLSRQLAVQYITDKRVDWIYEVRNTLSEFISSVEERTIGYDDVTGNRLDEGINHRIRSSYYKLKLLFNYQGNADKEIMKLLEVAMTVPETESDEANLYTTLDMIVSKSQQYLKSEWERVKHEAGEK